MQSDNSNSCNRAEKLYFGKRGNLYYQNQSRNGAAWGKIRARTFIPYIDERHDVLDFGCGGGFVLDAISCRQKIGVEINPTARDAANEKGVKCFESLESISDSSVDVVISNHCLEHLGQPIETLLGLRRVLKEGGRLIIVVPIDDWRNQMEVVEDDVDFHLYTWTPKLLGNMVTLAGYRLDAVKIWVQYQPVLRFLPNLYESIPGWLFNLIMRTHSALRRRREIVAVALKK